MFKGPSLHAYNIIKLGKIIPYAQNIPNGHKIFQMVVKIP
jgi:hypothetical protein